MEAFCCPSIQQLGSGNPSAIKHHDNDETKSFFIVRTSNKRPDVESQTCLTIFLLLSSLQLPQHGHSCENFISFYYYDLGLDINFLFGCRDHKFPLGNAGE